MSEPRRKTEEEIRARIALWERHLVALDPDYDWDGLSRETCQVRIEELRWMLGEKA